MTAAEAREAEAAGKARRCALAKCPLAGQGDARCEKCTGPVAWTDGTGRRVGRGGKARRACHGCPMDGLGLPVCWAGCDGPPDGFQTDGQSMVSLGGMAGQEGVDAFLNARMAYEARMARLPRSRRVTAMPPAAEEYVLRLLGIFTRLTARQVVCLHAMANAKNEAEAARTLGVTKQAMHNVTCRILARFPELRAVLRVSKAEGERGGRGGAG